MRIRERKKRETKRLFICLEWNGDKPKNHTANEGEKHTQQKEEEAATQVGRGLKGREGKRERRRG